jgi:hypothetical protein
VTFVLKHAVVKVLSIRRRRTQADPVLGRILVELPEYGGVSAQAVVGVTPQPDGPSGNGGASVVSLKPKLRHNVALEPRATRTFPRILQAADHKFAESDAVSDNADAIWQGSNLNV